MIPTEEQVATVGRDIVGILLFADVDTRVALRETAESIARTILTQVLTGIENQIEAQITHMDVVDPNGRPRPCQEEWPGGRCNCQRGKVLAIIRGEA